MEHLPDDEKPLLDNESSISKQDGDCERENRMETGVETGVDAPGMETGTDWFLYMYLHMAL